jgi:nucleoside-diphosphate-sugar epimerase
MTRRAEEIPRLQEFGAEAVICDAFDAEGLKAAVVGADPECVVHEMTSLPKVFDAARLDEQLAVNNRLRSEGTRNLVAAAEAAGATKIVAQSIAFAYSPEGAAVKEEEAPLFLDAPDVWGRSVGAVRDLEEAVVGSRIAERVVLRYGHLYGPGTSYAPDGQFGGGVKAGAIPIAGEGEGVFSFVHLDDVANATVAAVEDWPSGVYNVVDDEPTPARVWLPYLAEVLGAPAPPRAPEERVLEAAGWLTLHQLTEMRGASNRRAKSETGWKPLHPSWREGFANGLG